MRSNSEVRILILKIFMCFVGLVFIVQLFNLQIVNGKSYREESEKRVLRQMQVTAPRGEILDRYGEILASNREGFNILFYRVKMTDDERNSMILKLANLMKAKGTKYRDTFPVELSPLRFEFSSDFAGVNWKKSNKLDENISVGEVFDKFSQRYKVSESYTPEEKRSIIGIRYELEMTGYSAFRPYELATDVSKEVIAELSERGDEFPGISIEIQPIRSYPNGNLASHILGYIGKISQDKYEELKDDGYSINDNVGKDGIESVMEKYLKGKNSLQKVEVDAIGRYTSDMGNTEATSGDQVYLTIDSKLQSVTEKSLKENIEKIASGHYSDGSSQAKSGAVVAIDVNTGEVLAMASYPDYDPNLFVKGISNKDWNELNNETKPMFNRNIMGLYSPGSIYKMVVAAAALESGAINENTMVKDEGRYTKYKSPQPKCWIWSPETGRTHGTINVSDAIKHSCNYFFYAVSELTGIEKIEEMARMFGLGEKTGIELPGEKTGIIAGKTYADSENRKWMPGETLSAAIGQSANSFTPIEIARYIAILANGGKRIEPHIIKSVINNDGDEIARSEIDEYLKGTLGEINNDIYGEEIKFNKTTLNEIYKGMESVTGDAGGTAYNMFKDFPVKVAGKTGTVQVGGNRADNAWFLGFAPYDNPEIAICAVIEQGAHGNYTAPIIKDILEEYFVLKEAVSDINTTAVVNNNEILQ